MMLLRIPHRKLFSRGSLQDPVMMMASMSRRSSSDGTCPTTQSYLLNWRSNSGSPSVCLAPSFKSAANISLYRPRSA